MNKNKHTSIPKKEVTISKEDAVFWMDAQGNWCNRHGKFENRRIAAYFHAAIKRDGGGYHLAQIRGDIYEKVYFRYEDTALFVFKVEIGAGKKVTLRLNTGKTMHLDPVRLFVKGPNLYLEKDQERIKFTDRAMMKLSDIMDFEGERYFIQMGDRRHEVRQIPPRAQTD
jgi:hypothetical protein